MRVYHRNATIFAGIFTTIQGVIWAFITVYSLGVYGCNFDFPFYDDQKPTVGTLFYFSYFMGNCRFSDPGRVPSAMLNLVHPHRTYILMTIYGILSAVWIPSSILILVIAVNKIHGKRGSCCYFPWIITTGALLLLDIIATIIYSIDVSHSLTIAEYTEYFSYPFSLKGMDGLTVIPAVLMILLSCRIVVIYLINLVLFGVVIQASNALRSFSPTAAFVENDARLSPSKDYGVKPSSWVRMGRKPGGVSEASIAEELDMPRLQERPSPTLQSMDRRPQRPTTLPLEAMGRPPRPVLKLPLSSSSDPPPPPAINSQPPFYDVYGKPTTPDSPQPAFVRTRSPLTEGVNNSMPWSYMNPQKQLPKHIPEPDYNIRQKRPNPTTVITPPDEDVFPPGRRFENNPNVWKVM